jgi:tetratricopeptide (TPR) repeat protein
VDRIDRYELREEISRGAGGVIYRAWDPDANEEVALKLLHGANASHAHVRRRFEREVTAMLLLRHPHVVALRDAGQSAGCPYLVMDLVKGESLQARLDQQGPMPPREAAILVRQLAEALQHVHEHGVVHRDLKPANVVVSADGTPRLVDFGLARDLRQDSSLSKTGVFLGTPGYWPPEQARGELERIGAASDIYSLGATLYAALTRQPPFAGESLVILIEAACERKPLPPSRLVLGLDRRLEAICLRCLAKEPKDRFPSAEALAQALDRWLASPTTKRPRRVLGLILAGSVLLGVAAVLFGAKPQAPSVATPPGQPDPDLDPARAKLEARDYTGAQELLRQAVARAPDSIEAWLLKGKAHAVLAQNVAAIEAFTRVIELAPGDARGWCGRGASNVRDRRSDSANSDLSRALELDPALVEAYLDRTLARIQLDRFADALLDAERAVALAPQLSRAYVVRGLAHEAARQTKLAEDDLERASHLVMKEEVEAWTLRGTLHAELSQWDAADDARSRAIALAPGNAESWYQRGKGRSKAKRHADALEDFDHALELDPKNARACRYRGTTHEALGNHAQAAADLNRASELGDTKALRTLASLLRARGEHQAALEVANRALAQAPDDQQALRVRADIYRKLDQPSRAWGDLVRLSQLRPDDLKAHYDLARVLLEELDDPGAALQTLDRIIAREPGYKEALLKASRAQRSLGHPEEALKYADQAVAVTPENADAWVERARIKEALNDPAGALDDVAAALARQVSEDERALLEAMESRLRAKPPGESEPR